MVLVKTSIREHLDSHHYSVQLQRKFTLKLCVLSTYDPNTALCCNFSKEQVELLFLFRQALAEGLLHPKVHILFPIQAIYLAKQAKR